MTGAINIAIHPPFPWLVDWPALASSGGRWYLVTQPEGRDRLAREGRSGGLAEVVALASFDLESLSRAVTPWVEGATSPDQVRLTTMIEPMQAPVACLRDRLGVPGPRPADILPFTDKLAMKRALAARGLQRLLPRYLRHDAPAFAADPRGYTARVAAELGWPIFAKPVAENSSRGTARIDSASHLVEFLSQTEHAGALELDEFVEGEGYHLDALVLDGKLAWFGAGLYAAPQGKTLQGAPHAGVSIAPGHPLFAELEAMNAEILGAFDGLPDGCTHMELLRRPDGRWVFLEVAARVPGSRMPEMHRIARGVDLRLAHYQAQAGLRPHLAGRLGPHAGYFCPMKTRPGRISRWVEPPLESAYEMDWNRGWLERTDVAQTMSMPDCIGYCVFQNDDRAALERDFTRLFEFQAYALDE